MERHLQIFRNNILRLTSLRTEKTAAGNTGLAKVAVSCSKDTFVVKQTLVFRMNICGKNRQLLVAAKRYRQA
jgi:hypothetical protein